MSWGKVFITYLFFRPFNEDCSRYHKEYHYLFVFKKRLNKSPDCNCGMSSLIFRQSKTMKRQAMLPTH